MMINVISVLVLAVAPVANAINRTILVTGATDGIGKATASELAKNLDNHVIVHGRNETKCQSVVESIKLESPSSTVDYIVADFANMHAVKQMAEDVQTRFPLLNVLVNNAGLMSKEKQTTQDGLDMVIQVNHLAHFLLTVKLLPLLKKNRPSRVVVVGSMAYNRSSINWTDVMMETSYDGRVQYGRSKLMNHLFAFALARRFANDSEIEKGSMTCNVLEPGGVATKIGGGNRTVTSRRVPVEVGAITPIYLAQSPDVQGVNGELFSRSKEIMHANAVSRDEDEQEKLWQWSEDQCKKLGVW